MYRVFQLTFEFVYVFETQDTARDQRRLTINKATHLRLHLIYGITKIVDKKPTAGMATPQKTSLLDSQGVPDTE